MYAQNVHIKEKGAIAERKNNKCKKKGMIYIMDKIAGVIAQELGVKEFQVQNTIKLIDDGNTIPFIARYRKEATGGLSDEVLRNLNDRLTYLRNLNKRKEEISKSIEEQGKMTDELKIQIENAIILSEVEDIYRPYKQKKRTRASIAKEKGLEPLATIIYLQTDKRPVLEIAKEFINEEKGVNNEEEALTGAKDIIAENISDVAEYRKRIKQMCYREGLIKTKATNDEEKSSYEMYYDFSEKINRIPSHRILAINRGEKEDFLKVKLEKPEDTIINYIENDIIKGNTEFTDAEKENIVGTVLYLNIDGNVIGRIVLTDEIKPKTKETKIPYKTRSPLALGAR